MERPILGLPIVLSDAGPAFFFPPWATLIVDLDLIDRLVSMSFRQYRYRHPHSPLRRANPIAILKVVLPVLHMIQHHKHVRLPNLVEKPQPRQVFRLMDSYNHTAPSTCPRSSLYSVTDRLASAGKRFQTELLNEV